MPDYVYAVHDFAPEHEDEISFKAGERIEILERDDVYSDGWWQVSAGRCSWSTRRWPPFGTASARSLARLLKHARRIHIIITPIRNYLC